MGGVRKRIEVNLQVEIQAGVLCKTKSTVCLFFFTYAWCLGHLLNLYSWLMLTCRPHDLVHLLKCCGVHGCVSQPAADLYWDFHQSTTIFRAHRELL